MRWLQKYASPVVRVLLVVALLGVIFSESGHIPAGSEVHHCFHAAALTGAITLVIDEVAPHWERPCKPIEPPTVCTEVSTPPPNIALC